MDNQTEVKILGTVDNEPYHFTINPLKLQKESIIRIMFEQSKGKNDIYIELELDDLDEEIIYVPTREKTGMLSLPFSNGVIRLLEIYFLNNYWPNPKRNRSLPKITQKDTEIVQYQPVELIDTIEMRHLDNANLLSSSLETLEDSSEPNLEFMKRLSQFLSLPFNLEF